MGKYSREIEIIKSTYNAALMVSYLGHSIGKKTAPKKTGNLTEYRHQETAAFHFGGQDRVFPLETVAIQSFRREHGRDLDRAIIHYGPNSDELARSFNVIALTIGYDVFFRNNAFNPAGGEGRKTLAHELTHAAQDKEGLIGSNASREELEADAEAAEWREENASDPIVGVAAGKRIYRIRESQIREVELLCAEKLREWIRVKKETLPEEKRLRFLIRVKKWIEESGGL